LHFRSYRIVWIGGLVINMAVNGQTIARGWLAKELTGTNAGLGGVLLAFGVAMLLATPLGGVAADRLPKRALLIGSQSLLVVSSLWIGLAVQFDVVEYWMLMGASAIQAVAFAIYGPTRMAFTGELVDNAALSNAIVLGQMGSEAMRIVGPTLAGVLIGAATWGLQAVFLSASVLCAISVVMTFLLPAGRPSADRPDRSPFADLQDGLRYVRDRRDLTVLVLCSLSVVMIGYPYMAFMPTVAQGIFDRGSSGYGMLSAASAVGAVIAGVFSARRSHRHDPWKFVTVAGFGFCAGLLVLGVTPTFGLALVVLAFTGAMSLAFQSMLQTLLLDLSDFDYHGRIQSLVMLGFSGFGIAALPLGLLADAIGLRTTFVLMGATVGGIMVLFVSATRRVRARELVLDLG
jgi:MFS family permease